MTSAIKELSQTPAHEFDKIDQTEVGRGEVLRYSLYTRLLHWAVAITFILALLTGFAIYSPRLFAFLTPLFGGGATTRFLHPWFSLAFVLFFFLQFLHWLAPMVWTKADSRFMQNIKRYATNQDKVAPEDTGFFNGGQKLYFWAIAVSALLFLVSGILIWFDDVVSGLVVAISYVIHDVAALVMLGGFFIHIYQSTISEPGTLRSMLDGTVTRDWAWTHHPAWYRKITGRGRYEESKEDKTTKRF